MTLSLVTALVISILGYANESKATPDCGLTSSAQPVLVRERKGGEYLDYTAKGLPPGAVWTTSTGTEVYRHYVNSAETLATVVASRTLRAGSRPYVRGDKYTKIVHDDLVGVFITTPEYTSAQVDGHSGLYVDFTLPAGTRVLTIVPGILLLPGAPGTPDWLIENLAKWRRDPKSVLPYMIPSLEKLDREPPRVPLTQIIDIVGHSPLKP